MAIVGGSVQLMRKDCLGNKNIPPILECERIVGCFLLIIIKKECERIEPYFYIVILL